MKKLILASLAILLMCPMTFAASKSVVVNWTCNTETDLAGYTIWSYLGTSTTPQTTTDVPHVTGMVCTKTISVTVPDGAVTDVCIDMDAYDLAANHSAHSTRVCKTVDLKGPAAPTNVTVTIQ